METRRKIRLSLALSIVAAAAIPAGNCLTNSLVGVMFPTPVPNSNNGSSNHQTTAPSAVSAAAIHQVESKRMEQWSPSPPDLSHHMQQHQPPQQPQTSYGLPSYSQQHNSHPFMPANYYLPVNDEPTIGNNYGTAAATEFRSDHYPYPFDPPTAYAYPIAAQPQVDTSLIPTAKHFVIVSFIGLLLLFAIIQNSIAAAKRKDALVEVLSNRRKRELDEANYQLLQPAEAELTRKEDLRIRCVQRNLCLENRKLREDLGVFGKVLAKYLTRSVQGSLREISSDWDDLVEDAASAGLKGDDCYQVYDNCEANSSDVDYNNNNNNNNSATNEDETKT